MKSLTIGFAGPVTLTSSPHATWITRGLETIRRHMAQTSALSLEILVCDDRADALGGEAATRALLGMGVAGLAGYFSSASALASASDWTRAACPVVIAGATADGANAAPGVLRVCDTATDYAAWIADSLPAAARRSVTIVAQQSPFGASLARSLHDMGLGDPVRRPQAAIVLGQASYARSAVLQVPSSCKQVIVTDDCQNDEDANELARCLQSGQGLRVAGFTDRPHALGAWAEQAARRRWVRPPGAFFYETIAAVQTLVLRLTVGEGLREVETVLGPLTFDAHGEARPQRFQMYQVSDGRLAAEPPD